jgi:hypothetical protein
LINIMIANVDWLLSVLAQRLLYAGPGLERARAGRSGCSIKKR